MKHKTIIRILSVFILAFSIIIPMWNLWPEGIIPCEEAWTALETIETIADEGNRAFRHIGVAFHLAAWIPGTLLCFTAVFASEIASTLASSFGVFSLSGILLYTIMNQEMPEIIDLTDGYVTIGYWVVLGLFVICWLLGLKNSKEALSFM